MDLLKCKTDMTHKGSDGPCVLVRGLGSEPRGGGVHEHEQEGGLSTARTECRRLRGRAGMEEVSGWYSYGIEDR